jgi:hypothetical protein
MRRAFKSLLLILSVWVLMADPRVSAVISITATGSWYEVIDENDLESGPGSDLKSTYESAVDEVVIDITGTVGDLDNWRVDVKRVDSNWHSQFHLYDKRTSEGSGTGSISGGTAYQEIGEADQSFFTGSGDRTNIAVQLKLGGMSIQVSPDVYSTDVYYTVVDID